MSCLSTSPDRHAHWSPVSKAAGRSLRTAGTCLAPETSALAILLLPFASVLNHVILLSRLATVADSMIALSYACLSRLHASKYARYECNFDRKADLCDNRTRRERNSRHSSRSNGPTGQQEWYWVHGPYYSYVSDNATAENKNGEKVHNRGRYYCFPSIEPLLADSFSAVQSAIWLLLCTGGSLSLDTKSTHTRGKERAEDQVGERVCCMSAYCRMMARYDGSVSETRSLVRRRLDTWTKDRIF